MNTIDREKGMEQDLMVVPPFEIIGPRRIKTLRDAIGNLRALNRESNTPQEIDTAAEIATVAAWKLLQYHRDRADEEAKAEETETIWGLMKQVKHALDAKIDKKVDDPLIAKINERVASLLHLLKNQIADVFARPVSVNSAPMAARA
jgi:hypothetical protein